MIFFTLLIIPVYAQESNIIRLSPTDDTFIVVDFTDPNNIRDIPEKPLGDLDVITTWYVWNFLEDNKNFAAIYLKFDLGDITPHEIESATLLLHASQTKEITNSPNIAIFSLDDTSWSEKNLTFESDVVILDKISESKRIEQPGMYEWDITQHVVDSPDSQIGFGVKFDTVVDSGSERVTFISKDSTLSNYHPTLLIKILSEKEIEKNKAIAKLEQEIANLKEDIVEENDQPTNSNSVKIIPSEDTFIGLDISDFYDNYDLKNLRAGDLDFIKIWYSNNATSTDEFIITSGLLTFDLPEINFDDIANVNLNMKTIQIDSSGADKILSIHKLNHVNWNESEITYNTKPSFELQDLVSAEVTESNVWHTWNITDMIKDDADSKLSLILGYQTLESGFEEQTVFYSKESKFPPYLEITLKESTLDAKGGGCLIATATYGSELAPQVQALREIRDNSLLDTESGKSFMKLFNQFYYSFSPQIADLERENTLFKEAVKIGLTPLLSSLSILNYIDMDSEDKVLGYGIGIILMNIGMYFVAPVMLLYKSKKFYNL